MITVVIADDDVRVRDDFQAILALEDDMRVVGVAADGLDAVRAAGQFAPDVVVMDIRMPRLDGIEATRRIRAVDAAPRVLVMTTFDLDKYVWGAVRAGASGFLLKDTATDHLAPAVRTVAAGDGIVAPRATARLLEAFVRPASASAAAGLTAREIEVVRLMALGYSNDDIAASAYISRATVKTHVSSVLAKLGVSSRLQAVVWAYEHEVAP